MSSEANRIIGKMYKTDAFSQWLGIKIVEIKPGYAKLKMVVRPNMVNGFGTAHGGITFSFADSALAFAANGHGKLAVALDCNISFPKAVNRGDELIAEAIEFSCGNKVGVYNITVTNQKEEKVAFFKGTVYRTAKDWEV